MKKLVLTGITGVFLLAITSCGHGDCDAYHKSDYSKYQSEKQSQIEFEIEILKNHQK